MNEKQQQMLTNGLWWGTIASFTMVMIGIILNIEKTYLNLIIFDLLLDFIIFFLFGVIYTRMKYNPKDEWSNNDYIPAYNKYNI